MTSLPDTTPADDIEALVVRSADATGLEYRRVRIDPQYANTQMFCDEYGYSMDASANCIVVASKTADRRYAACLVQATRRLDVNGTVRRLLGVRKASFAPPEETVALTGMLPDGVTPFGLPEDLPLYVDEPIMSLEWVIVGGGSRSLKLEVPAEAFRRLANATVVEGLSKTPPPTE